MLSPPPSLVLLACPRRIVVRVPYTVMSTTITDLLPGVEYAVSVSSVNTVGDSPSSATLTVTPCRAQHSQAPLPPAAVTAIAGIRSAIVSWTPARVSPCWNGSVDAWNVTASCGSWASFSGVAAGAAASIILSGLPRQTSCAYTVVVFSHNSGGWSARGNAAAASVSPIDIPGAPTGVTAASGNQSAIVQWSMAGVDNGACRSLRNCNIFGMPRSVCLCACVRFCHSASLPVCRSLSDSIACHVNAVVAGGAVIIGFIVVAIPVDGGAVVNVTTAGDVFAVVVRGLVPEAAYWVNVSAVNVVGTGPYGASGGRGNLGLAPELLSSARRDHVSIGLGASSRHVCAMRPLWSRDSATCDTWTIS